MKNITLTLVSILILISNTSAQKLRTHKPPNGFKIAGVSACIVGSGATLVGLFLYGVEGDTGGRGTPTNTPAPQNNDGLIVAGVGGGLIVGGVVLIVVGVSHNKKSKISITMPKKNEIGLAYNF